MTIKTEEELRLYNEFRIDRLVLITTAESLEKIQDAVDAAWHKEKHRYKS